MREHWPERLDRVVRAAGHDDVEQGGGPSCASPGEQVRDPFRVKSEKCEVAADRQGSHAGQHGCYVRDAQFGIGPGNMDVPPVLAVDGQDDGLRRGGPLPGTDAVHQDPLARQAAPQPVPVFIVAHLAD